MLYERFRRWSVGVKGNGNAGGGGVMIVNQHAERMAIASVVEDVSGKICRQLVTTCVVHGEKRTERSVYKFFRLVSDATVY